MALRIQAKTSIVREQLHPSLAENQTISKQREQILETSVPWEPSKASVGGAKSKSHNPRNQRQGSIHTDKRRVGAKTTLNSNVNFEQTSLMQSQHASLAQQSKSHVAYHDKVKSATEMKTYGREQDFPQESNGIERAGEEVDTLSALNIKTKPINIVDPTVKPYGSAMVLNENVGLAVPNVQQDHSKSRVKTQAQSQNNPRIGIPVGQSVVIDMIGENYNNDVDSEEPQLVNLKKQVSRLNEEKSVLKNELDKQVEVNAELKKLLVASLGDDLQYRMERMARDKAHLQTEVGDYSQRVCRDSETLETLSIQADKWRSKFLASRMLIDELSRCKAHLLMQYKESQNALQQIMIERQEIKANLLQTHSCLKRLKDGFDPAGAKAFSHTQSNNALELSKTNKGLAEAVSFRLIGPIPACSSHGAVNLDMGKNDDLTPGETFAKQLLSNPSLPTDTDLLPPQAQSIAGRFHPMVRYEELTFGSCRNCKGEINVV